LFGENFQEVFFLEALREYILLDEPLLPFSFDVVVSDEFETASSMEALSLLYKLSLDQSFLRNVIS
jgi:hypothetical protein